MSTSDWKALLAHTLQNGVAILPRLSAVVVGRRN